MSADTSPPAAASESDTLPSRRAMLRGTAAAGAAGLAATMLAAPAHAAPAAQSPEIAEPAPRNAEPVVVHLRDAESGELDVFTGHEHRRVTDPALADALRRAAR
ncbi:hypothetical protein [Yinghuangia soli]|uniref:Tat (Twin-arginine translocation) pathway signal sequence n=1 Tax=Yinghuangia soli TaxID=2908204 RepID=A0AA41QC30_9ACTN|nr:hypothetical protein [Yinghuangia soli]MCF2534042.1 hypothetical protein [Yinghuangia soli]